MTAGAGTIRQGCILTSPTLPEPIEVLATVPMGDSLKVIGRGCNTGLTHDPVLSPSQLADVVVSADREPFDGDARMFRLGVEANRLGLAYEYDPFFSLSIARVDPLPHQLEAVYSYFMKLPRIRFLLADDPGAGKTIMAGLLLKELKARGLVKRVLIVAPASLTFQWQREMADKFREKFEVIRGDVLRANYGQNPWQERDQVVTSVSWVSIVEDARESLLRSRWDLVIVDEAHKMSARSEDHKTYAYRLGENLSKMTDHYLLMTATPHKGDPEHFRRFLALLDADVYGSIQSLEQAMRDHEAPFYLRRTKEALVTFPDPDTGVVRKLFTKREVRSAAFDLNGEELGFYDELTRYVEDQSMAAAADGTARGRAVGFTMAMLQRRMASSIYAVRRSLERMRTRREKILADPEAYRQEQIQRRIPDDFDELDTVEQQQVIDDLESEVLSVDPAALKEEIVQLTRLVNQAVQLESLNIQTKVIKLRSILNQEGIFDNKKTKLLIFTEHKDTLDFLAGDGKDGRPLGKLVEWGLSVTQIHGGMKIGDRDTPGSRICAEREFKEEAQVLVATEAAGEGINLQFCWLMINFDIPWNPVRLEQRVGRIHRYGQEKDCLIFNFIAHNTREGRVLRKLLDRLAEIRLDLGSDQVFDVVGEIFPANQLERMLRDMYARQTDVSKIEDRIVRDVSPDRFRQITESTLEGLAKKELNLSNLIGKHAEAKERRLVPEVIEQFFIDAAPESGMRPKEKPKGSHLYQIGKVPRTLLPIGDRQEDRFGRLGREYKQVTFDKLYLRDNPTLEWVTPGHPLFESVRTDMLGRTADDLRRGAVFYDLHRNDPALIDIFAASIKDGRGRTLHRRLFAVETALSGQMKLHEPTVLLDVAAAPPDSVGPSQSITLPSRQSVEQHLYQHGLAPWVSKISSEQCEEIKRIRRHVEISLNALINRAQLQQAEYLSRKIEGETVTGLDGLIAQAEQHLDDLTNRLENRQKELELERHTSISDITHLGRAWVAPHPDRGSPQFAPMVRDDEIERIAVEEATRYEESRGCVVESVESENRGFDLISRKPNPNDPKTFLEVRFIEVKGRAGVGIVALSENEYRTAERLRDDYWLYAVFNCASSPELNIVQDPAKLGWEPVTSVEHYQVTAKEIRGGQRHMNSLIVPSEHEIRRLAHELYVARGSQDGWDVADWIMAERTARFHKNYERVALYPLSAQEKIYLGSKENRKCRFCRRSAPEVSFSKDAHAIPAFLGNRSVFSLYECNDCNNAFSEYLEDDFAKMLNGVRTAVRIRGRSAIPKYKSTRGMSRIEVVGDSINIRQSTEEPIANCDPATHQSSFDLKTQRFIPLAVYKCFAKIALSLMPEAEVPNFEDTMAWVRDRDHSRGAGNFRNAFAFRAMTPGPLPDRYGWVEIFRRRHNTIPVPYMVIVVTVMNLTFQTYVPLCVEDSHLLGKTLTVPRFPAGFNCGYEYGETTFNNMRLSGTEPMIIDVQVGMNSESELDGGQP